MTNWRGAMLCSMLALVVATTLFPVTSWDLPWHLRVGRDIVATGHYPHGDVYSFTRPGGYYVEDEWLFQVVVYGLDRLAGWRAFTIAKVLLVAVSSLAVFAEASALSGSPTMAALLVGMSVVAARSRVLERPDVLNLLFFPLVLVLVSAYRRTGRGRLLLLLPPLFGIWANCHSGVTLGLVVVGSMALADVACRLLPRLLKEASAGNPWHFLGVVATCGLASLVNPIGPHILTFPFEVVGKHLTVEWHRTPPALFPLFFVLGSAFVLASVVTIKHLDLAELGAYSMLFALGMRHVRMLAIFSIVAALPLARTGAHLVGRLPIPRSAWALDTWRQRLYAGVSVVLLVMAGYYTFLNGYHGLGMGAPEDYYPEGAASFILRERPPAFLWNEFTLGGYFIYRLYPTYKVFIDNREEPYYTLLDELRAAMRSPATFAEHLDHWRINTAVTRYTSSPFVVAGPDGTRVERGWPFYFEPRRWALVYWDDVALVFVRRSAVDDEFLARIEVKDFNPDDWRLHAIRAQADEDHRQAALRELSRKLAVDPSCDRARWLLGVFASMRPGPTPPGDGR